MVSINSKLKAIIGALIIIVPVVVLLFLHFFGQNRFHTLPILGPRSLNENGDTIYHHIPDFTFINQLNQPYGSDSLKGLIHVADFIFTTCNGICPKMSSHFSQLQEKISKYSDVKLVSISVDPKRDTAQTLNQYAKKYKANPHFWKFLTAEQSQIVNIATKGYFLPLDVSGKGKEFGITHSEMAVLVDKDLRIRNFYDLTNPNNIKTIEEDIRILKLEYSNPQMITKKSKK